MKTDTDKIISDLRLEVAALQLRLAHLEQEIKHHKHSSPWHQPMWLQQPNYVEKWSMPPVVT